MPYLEAVDKYDPYYKWEVYSIKLFFYVIYCPMAIGNCGIFHSKWQIMVKIWLLC